MADETIAREWGLERGLIQTLFAPAAEALLSMVDVRGKRVLDAGCGSGIVARCAVSQGAAEVQGVDHCAEAIEVARTVADDARLHFSTRNLVTESIADLGAFDVVVAAHVVEQIEVEAAARLADALAPGGVLVLTAWWIGGLERCPAYDLIYTATGLRERNRKTFERSPQDLRSVASRASLDVQTLEVSALRTRPLDRAEQLVEQFLAGTSFGARHGPADHERFVRAARELDETTPHRDAEGCIAIRQAVLVARRRPA